MRSDLCSKDDLIAVGWKARQIDAVLDDPDEVGPSGHWLSSSGKPYYLRDRVAVAAFRTGITEQKPTADVWNKWKSSAKPTSTPVSTFDFHRIADDCHAGTSRKFRSLRLTHPVIGRQPGTRDAEGDLIETVLRMLVQKSCGLNLVNASDISQFFSERSALSSAQSKKSWPQNLVVRSALRASYVSKATGKQTVEKFLDAMALVHVGAIRGYDSKVFEVRNLLICAPQVRFDRSGQYDE